VVTATGMGTELGRIAALSQRVEREESPLEHQVKRAAWLIALVAVGAGLAFLPIGLAAGLSLAAAAGFAIGLLVANVPEGLLPTITLALAVGVRDMARRGALVKRLSGVETLGSTTVICTDKTGTLTQNRMRVTAVWTLGADGKAGQTGTGGTAAIGGTGAGQLGDCDLLAQIAARCNNAEFRGGVEGKETGDPRELALLEFAAARGLKVSLATRQAHRRGVFRFDPRLKLMTTVDEQDSCLVVNTKGAPAEVLARSTSIHHGGGEQTISAADRNQVLQVMGDYARQGLRVLAVAHRTIARWIGCPGAAQRRGTAAVPGRAGRNA
jgi:magnesium-transporting ATPase (P-type)